MNHLSVNINYTELGNANKPCVILIHGLFGSISNLRGIAKSLSGEFRVFIIDNRNHGNSPWSSEMNYDLMADDIFHFCQHHQLVNITLLGHSMGGKVAMLCALKYPDLVHRIIVADIAPKAYEHQDEHINYIQAMQSMNLTAIKNRQQALQSFIALSGASQLTAQFICQNLVADHDDNENTFRWRINLSSLKKNLPNILDFSYQQNASFTKAAYFIYGQCSNYLKDHDKENIQNIFPQSQFSEMIGAHHWLHAEKPEEFNELVLSFLCH